jgi:hypothetical protein
MPPENEPGRLLREQAAVLSAAVNDMSEQLGNVANGLVSLQSYGHRNRRMIVVTIISLVIDLSLTVALTIVTFNVIANNQKTNANIESIHCLTNRISESIHEDSAYNDASIAALNLKTKALAKDVSLQINNTSAAERHAAQLTYLTDINAIDRIKTPPRPVFNPHC